MTNFSQDDKELIFDYAVGVCSQQQSELAQEIISSNPQAAELYELIKNGLSPLDSWQVSDCPDELVESAVARLRSASQQGQAHLERLLAHEEARGGRPRRTVWVRRLAMAATFMIVGHIVISGMKYARYKSWQLQCQAQLASIGQGITNYSEDYAGSMPAVVMRAGTPWWKVGYQGQENHSNTRGVWLLVKTNYVGADKFVCPGAKSKGLEPIGFEKARLMNDFPDRRYVPYSLRLNCEKPVRISTFGRRVIMSDLNPLFEKLPDDFNRPLNVPLTERLSRQNSINHRRKGQNVLFCDGNVAFNKTRRVSATNDDIFTLQGKSLYEGVEVPTCDADDFLAP
ncbi:MAG: hypothetical protein PVG93_06690 [Phycisphaerales bacterium]|jgi:prepilin-type processing-associated H-X9-DG protein